VKKSLLILLLPALLISCGRGRKAEPPYYYPPPPPYPSPPPQPLSWSPDYNAEQYARISENDFRDVDSQPLSTFSIDVDAASYANVRRFITEGDLPPADAVRIEELINYFDYDYPQPSDGAPFSIIAEVSTCPWNQSHRLVHIGLQGKELSMEDLPPSNIVFLLDVSGSMDSPDKLPLVKGAFRLLVDRLREEDRVAIVVYAGAAGMALPPTSGADKRRILKAIDKLRAGGSTAGGQGIQLAYRVACDNFIEGGNNRVILATDGDFNVGITNDNELVRLIETKRREGIFLSVLGFGEGNLKDAKMEKLADNGNGNYAYIDNMLEARKVFVNELGGTLFTIAKDVKVQVEFNPARVESYRLLGYENRLLSNRDFANDRKDAGDMGAGHSVTVLYEIVPAGYSDDPDIPDYLRYQPTATKSEPEYDGGSELFYLKIRYKAPDETESRLIAHPVNDRGSDYHGTSDDFRFAAAVAEFGMLLRNSEFAGDITYDDILSLAESARGDDANGYRAEFIGLVEICKSLR
jgi:Ca-activated chloride channel family protein